MRKLLGIGAVLIAVAPFASAQSLTTFYGANNGGNNGGAVYFDVTVGPNALTVNGFDTNTAESGLAFGFFVYLRAGGGLGFETDVTNWLYEGGGVGQAMGLNNPSPVNISDDFVLQANTTYGMALVMGPEAGHDYTNGTGSNQNFSNADVAFSLGSASNVPFTAGIFTPRVWNGTMYYTAVPEPGTMAVLGLGLLPLLRRRRSKKT